MDDQQLSDEPPQGGAHRVLSDRVPVGEWRVDPGSSMVNVRARTFFGLLPVNGYFARFDGGLLATVDGSVSGELRLATGSLVTGIERRDEQLRAPALLDAAGHPTVCFALESLSVLEHQAERIVDEDRMQANGTLRLLSAELALEFPVTVIEHGDHLHVEARVRFDLRGAGVLARQPGLISRHARVDAALTLRRAG